jgi:hypothetical protein
MRGKVWVAVLLCAGAAGWSWRTEADRRLAEQVGNLVDQLADRDFPKREAAARSLEAFGETALPELRKALHHTDAEVRRRLQDLVPALERAAALSPKRVSLHLTNRPLSEAVAEITRQTGYKISLQPQGGDRDRVSYSFDLDRATFWEAIDKLTEAAELTFSASGNEQFQLAAQGNISPYCYQRGAFRFVADGFEYNRGIRFNQIPRTAGAGQRSESLTFSLSVATEPKLPLLALGEVKLAAAYDDRHRSMLPVAGPEDQNDGLRFRRGRRYSSYYGGGLNHMIGTQVNLVRPSPDSHAAQSIKGTVVATLLVEQRPEIVITDVLKSKGKVFKGGKTVWDMQDAADAGNKMYRFKMSITDENFNNGSNYGMTESLYQRIALEDAKGQKYQIRGSSWSSSSNTNVNVEFTFGDPGNGVGPPVRLVYYTWITMQHPVAFEFKDLPLP